MMFRSLFIFIFLLTEIETLAQILIGDLSISVYDTKIFEGNIYFATSNGVLEYKGNEFNRVKGSDQIFQELIVYQNHLFGYSYNNGIVEFKNGVMETIIKPKRPLSDRVSHDSFRTKATSSKLWFVVKNSLIFYDAKSKLFDSVIIDKKPILQYTSDKSNTVIDIVEVAGIEVIVCNASSLLDSSAFLFTLTGESSCGGCAKREFENELLFYDYNTILRESALVYRRNSGTSLLKNINGHLRLKEITPKHISGLFYERGAYSEKNILNLVEISPLFSDTSIIARIENDHISEIHTFTSDIHYKKFISYNNENWLLTSEKLLKFDGDHLKTIYSGTAYLHDVIFIESKAYICSHQGLQILDLKNGNVKTTLDSIMIEKVIQTDSLLLVFSGDPHYQGIWSYKDSELDLIGARYIRQPQIATWSNKFFIYGTGVELYPGKLLELYQNARLKVEVVNKNDENSTGGIFSLFFPHKKIFFNNVLRLEAYYEMSDGSKMQHIPKDVRILYADEKDDARKESRNGFGAYEKEIPITNFVQEFNIGTQRGTFYVRDFYGNTSFVDQRIFIIPGYISITLVTIIVWTFVFLLVIVLAPYVRFCNSILMNPILRNYGSFGLLPLFLSMSSTLRSHVFKRYKRNICQAEDLFAEARSKFILVDSKWDFSLVRKNSEKNHRVLIHGLSGTGKTTFLLAFTYELANMNKSRLIPVYVPLKAMRTGNPQEIFLAQLSQYGDFYDQQLALWYLAQGGFIFLFDGLNEIEKSQTNLINTFIYQNSKKNAFIVTSQSIVKNDLFDFETRKLRELDDETRRLFVAEKMDEAELKQFESTFNQIEFIRTIHDLELVIQEWRKHGSVPDSITELYASILIPLLSEFSHFDKIENRLFEHAFDMAVHNDYEIDTDSLPDELIQALLSAKLLIQHAGSYRFNHELMRSYFASKHFISKWRQILQPGFKAEMELKKIIDLAIDNIGDIEGLVLTLVEFNTDLATEVFNDIKGVSRFHTDKWSSKFYLALGKKTTEENKQRKSLES